MLSLHEWQRAKNNDVLLANFLNNNPGAFSFEDLPPDVRSQQCLLVCFTSPLHFKLLAT
jgi:hypothetical protein